jgi:DNA-binding NtrC family response regulator
MHSFLIVSRERKVVESIRKALSGQGPIESISDKTSALAAIRKKRCDIVFLDKAAVEDVSDKSSCENAVRSFKDFYPNLSVILIVNSGDYSAVANFAKVNGCDYLTKPIFPDEVRTVTERIIDGGLRKSELEYYRDRFWRSEAGDVVETRCENVREAYEKARSVAPTKTTVLLVGETGSGKGFFAKHIHLKSRREKAQFISVHCGAIMDTLLESELFGHEKGAFTGAIRRKQGKFEIAGGGTIFLDEIGTLTASAQIKLLQVLQDGTFYRVGGDGLLISNARVVAATNADLKKMADQGFFRKDLYYRLNVFPIEIPPLRERAEDIPLFVEAFVKKLEKSYRKGISGMHENVMEALMNYSWPGNIREFENLIERAYIVEKSTMLSSKSFPAELSFYNKQPTKFLTVDKNLPLAEARKKAVEEFESQYLKKLISRNGGKIKSSANEAGISTRQLHKLMRKYGLHKEDYKN